MTKKRNKLAPKKVEGLILIKENKTRIEVFKAKGIYELVRIDKNPFRTITVDEVIAGLVEEQTGSDVFNHEHDEHCAESIAKLSPQLLVKLSLKAALPLFLLNQATPPLPGKVYFPTFLSKC